MERVRLIIVDDDQAIRQGLRALVEALGAEVLAEADNGRACIEQAERLQPELVLLDVSMPVMGGFPAARQLRARMPNLRIIFVSQHRERIYIKEALEIGINGYVWKQAAATELNDAIQTVMSGGSFVSPLAKL
ncbi:MAG: response regulator transcription factor [Acidobacteriaceae bacterium]|nr:response regulator transcription factor [Acidobacteriaceae bacterium]MBV9307665.1 response regulator transcription factor [Acidobacteriaceae bacterium]MBV9678617.1 response regulator transcription factor [Acidobacteriaceae bacterium]